MHVHLVSPYHTGSHQAWAEGYAATSAHQVTLVTMSGRFWKWRMQGGSVSLAERTERLITQGGEPDVVLATDMVDLPSFLGLAPSLKGVPVVLYCHENQLGYPTSPRSQEDLTYGAMNWKSMLAADVVTFNSRFHRDELMSLLPGFLESFPDHRHTHRVSEVSAKSTVLYPGIDASLAPARPRVDEPPLLLWNQRWEHDKNPAGMIRAIDAVLATGRTIRVALAGENFRNSPEEFLAARRRWADVLVHFGWAEEEDYRRLLSEADIVLSTADHEYFGIAVVEALAAGAWPVLPRRLSYPEILDPDHADDHLYETDQELVEMLLAAIDSIGSTRALSAERAGYYRRYDWSELAPQYDEMLAETAATGRLAVGS